MTSSGLSEGERIGLIIGGVLFGLILVTVIIILVILYCRRKQRNAETSHNVFAHNRAPVAHYPQSMSTNQPTNHKIDYQPSNQRSHHAINHQNITSFEKVEPSRTRHSNFSTTNNYDVNSTIEYEHQQLPSDVFSDPSPPSAYIGPLVQSRPHVTPYPDVSQGIANPVFEDTTGSIDRRVSQAERRRNRMDRNTAAAIAAEKDRKTSVFNIEEDADSLADNESVIVFDQRTAL